MDYKSFEEEIVNSSVYESASEELNSPIEAAIKVEPEEKIDVNQNFVYPSPLMSPSMSPEVTRMLSTFQETHKRRLVFTGKIPNWRPHHYSPCLRKPNPVRPMATVNQISTLAQPEQKIFKCPSAGCLETFNTAKSLQVHQRRHKPSSYKCSWCIKKFQVAVALQNHLAENCTKIPFKERRKVLAQREKKEKERRSTTLFMIPKLRRTLNYDSTAGLGCVSGIEPLAE